MKFKLAQRTQKLLPSPTLTLNARIKQMQAQGQDIINLTAGELDFPTPKNVCAAAKKAIDEDFTKYTASGGTTELKKAIVAKFKKDNQLNYTVEQVMASDGAKQALFNAFFTLTEPGAEVIMASPCWGTYVEQIKLSGAKPVMIKLKPPFNLQAKQIQTKINKRTRVILLNYPANPTGATISLTELKKIAELAVENKIWVIADEVYEKLTFKLENFISIASLNSKIFKQTITINGLSKAQAMTGWRIGYAAGPKNIIQQMEKIQAQITSNPCSITQKAAIQGLKKGQAFQKKAQINLKKRRDYLVSELSQIKQLSFSEPQGGFYFWVEIKPRYKKSQIDSIKWCQKLLKKTGVAVIPAEAFYAQGGFRMSFAANLNDLKKAMRRIKSFLDE
ncbi:MAG: aminotransferase class I/II-fold pyridoxal phosphate-dependent enzyme [Candidatus Moranbacteria bacterium]|nr:aminotransferase class I/II-fold pyridoxal phosphate-dependent enzyme [Candidatus Moranbacteria bacterium]